MTASHPFRSIKTPILLFLLCFFVYNANLRQISAGDTLPARYLPLILWHGGSFDLEADARLVAHGYSMIDPRNRPAGVDKKVSYLEPGAYWLIRTRDHRLASLYPVVTPLLVAPLYLPAVVWLEAHGWEQPQVDRVAELMEKFSASLLASITVVLLFLLLRREGNPWSLPLSLAFGFGTNTWVISSQALWQHGAGELLITLALVLSPTRKKGLLMLLGAICVLVTANRPPDALIAIAFAVFAICSHGRRSIWLLAGAAFPMVGLLAYNLTFIGNIGGGYALLQVHATYFKPIWEGLPGILLSPGRGLLVFSPFLVFVPLGLRQRLRNPDSKRLAIPLTVAVVMQVLAYSTGDWRAGVSWGPRWLTDVLPILVWMLAPVPLLLRPRLKALLILSMAASVGVQIIGAFWYTKVSDARFFENPASMRAVWDPRNLPYLVEFRHQHAHGDLRWEAVGGLGSTVLKDGSTVEGWLRAGSKPFRLWVLVDGIIIGWTADFVREGPSAPYRWRLPANTRGVAAGEHLVQIAVTFETGGNIRIVREQRASVVAPELSVPSTVQEPGQHELETMAKRAAALVRERQSAEGYWLTAFTGGTKYEATQFEMNTFLTAFMVDWLDPVASRYGLVEAMGRARLHLAAQIESTGLVRYHGLPDAPTIGKLGCIITPDPDDTALVWRITKTAASDKRLQPMLAELAGYRDARGLYRSWLAPFKQYQNLNPGMDPDPTDIGIQMNIYLMLRELDPPAAQDLSLALQRSYLDNDLWVYYSKAPLIPYLRSAELRRLGCRIPLPTERLALPAPGQEIWSEAGSLFVETTQSPPDAGVRRSIRDLLARLGNHDFELLRRCPPLMYHNDVTASVKRFYWSEDFGYALWLRLYQATLQ